MPAKNRILDITCGTVPDPDPDPSYLDQPGFEDRKAAYARGDFDYVGIRCDAEVSVKGTIQTIKSGGVWGVEDDSGKDYIRTIENEEFDQLKGVLRKMCFTEKAIESFRKGAT